MSVAARVDGSVAHPARPAWAGAGRVDTTDDVDRVLSLVTAAGQRHDRTAGLGRVVDRARDVALTEPDGARVLPVVAEFEPPWPGGLRRGATVAALGSTSLLFALLAEPMAAGAWAAVVGMPQLSAGPAVEYGVDLTRLVFVPNPGDRWAGVVGTLIDGFDLVVLAASDGAVPAGMAHTLMARARQRGCVLVPTGPWPGSDLTLEVTGRRWRGVGQGRGRLRLQQVSVAAAGRGRAERTRTVDTTLPPPSLAERVGPLAGQITGVPIELVLEPDRVFPSCPERAPRPAVAGPTEPDMWQMLMHHAGPVGRRAG